MWTNPSLIHDSLIRFYVACLIILKKRCWTNDITFEVQENETLWTCRPDLTITSLEDVKWSISHGYGEVKSACYEVNNFLLSKIWSEWRCFARMFGLLVLDVFHRLCIRSVNLFQPSRRRPTVSVPNFVSIFSTSQDRKWTCHYLKKYN